MKGSTNIFSMSLGYYSPVQSGAAARYSGDISSWAWTQYGQPAKAYAFTYDGAHRLTAGQFYSNGTSTNALSEKGISYDRAGNITALTRYDNSSSPVATSLSYAYTGNRRNAYSYDLNGNVTSDATNSLQSSYNLINLPAQIKSGSTVKANYSYLSDGTKAAAFTSASAGKDYAGSFTYSHASNGTKTLESVAFGGGRIRKSGSTYAVDYHITDHLGSVRAIVNASGTVIEQNDYYPFGNRHPNGLTQLAANRWRFSGKEEQDAAFGIAYSDFGARFYDRSAAWTAIDPMAEKYYSVSPYVYCVGNPVIRIDPNGLTDYFSTEGALLYRDGTDNGIIRIASQDDIQTVFDYFEKSKTTFFSFIELEEFNKSLEKKSSVLSSAIQSGSISHDSVLKIYNHYNETGLPLIEDSSISGNFAFGHNGDPSHLHIKTNVTNNTRSSVFDNSYNISNAINGHEGGHYRDWLERAHGNHFTYVSSPLADRERYAISKQREHPSWKKTTSNYRQRIQQYEDKFNK